MPASKTITWNGVSSETIPELVIGRVTRQLLGASRGTYLPVPGREGAWFFPEKRGIREITCECFVEGETFPTGRRDALHDVANWLDVEGQAALIISDEPDVYYEATVGDPPEPDEWREFGSFELKFLANPYSFALLTSTHSHTDDANHTDTWDPDVEVFTYPVITVTPLNGTLSSFLLTVNGRELAWSGNVASGQSVTVNSISAVVVSGPNTDVNLTGSYDSSLLVMSGVSGDFFTLVPGNNTIEFVRDTGTATSFSVVTTYRKKYRR